MRTLGLLLFVMLFPAALGAQPPAGTVVSAADIAACGLDSCFRVAPLSDAVFARMQGKSYPKGCRIGRNELRHVRVLHYDLEGHVRTGELVCNRQIADDVAEIFRELYDNKYPIGSVRLIDDFDADDRQSMRANNTSCFCYRGVAGGKKLSKHARGLAVDINPLYNPCRRRLSGGKWRVEPDNAVKYCDRSKAFPCKIDRNDLCYRLFTARGFRWGGNWRTLKDWQHFEK